MYADYIPPVVVKHTLPAPMPRGQMPDRSTDDLASQAFDEDWYLVQPPKTVRIDMGGVTWIVDANEPHWYV